MDKETVDSNAPRGRRAGRWRKAATTVLAVRRLAVTLIAIAARAGAVTRLAVATAVRRVDAVSRWLMAAARGAAARAGNMTATLRAAANRPPPGPVFKPGFWRSPLRGQWLTSLLGLVLLCGLPIVAVTGFLSYAAYNPRLPGNDETPGAPLLKFFLFSWPAQPSWLYRVDQATHITLGLALAPVVLAKLWSVLPKLFSWPPVRSPAHALERLSLVMIVGGALFEGVTGILNIQNFYIVPSFYTAHLYGGWVFIAGFVIHVILKFPQMRAGLRSRSLYRELRTPLAQTHPENLDPAGLRAPAPQAPTISRRGLLAAVGGAALMLAGLEVGQSIGGWTRWTALFGPRGLSVAQSGTLPVNTTAAEIGLTDADVGDAYRLTLTGAQTVTLTREQVLALPQHTVVLPIACVEGWSAAASWTGVRLDDLARLAGVGRPALARVESIERAGPFRQADLSGAQVNDPRSLLALRVNGADLSRDHGYPARTIIPDVPGVHNTKWVDKITFMESA
jgi:DMSO/TMAO reductase YedYZ molybdopterin-dependent catalytic subunit